MCVDGSKSVIRRAKSQKGGEVNNIIKKRNKKKHNSSETWFDAFLLIYIFLRYKFYNSVNWTFCITFLKSTSYF